MGSLRGLISVLGEICGHWGATILKVCGDWGARLIEILSHWRSSHSVLSRSIIECILRSCHLLVFVSFTHDLSLWCCLIELLIPIRLRIALELIIFEHVGLRDGLRCIHHRIILFIQSIRVRSCIRRSGLSRFELLRLLEHLLLLLLLSLKHALKCVGWVVTWGIRHRVLSDSFVFDHWGNDTLSSQPLNDVISGGDLGHWLLLIHKSESWNFCLLSWIANLKTIKNGEPEWERSELARYKHFSKPILPNIIVFQTREKLEIWPFLLSQPVPMGY